MVAKLAAGRVGSGDGRSAYRARVRLPVTSEHLRAGQGGAGRVLGSEITGAKSECLPLSLELTGVRVIPEGDSVGSGEQGPPVLTYHEH